MATGWQDLGRALGQCSGALVVACHQGRYGKWRRSRWVAPELESLLRDWAPPEWTLDQALVRQALAQRIMITDPLAGLGALPPQACTEVGRRVTVGATIALSLAEGRSVVAWLGLPGDTGRQRLESLADLVAAAADLAEARYRRFFEQIPAVFVAADMDGIILDCNAQVREMGYEPEELIGQPSALLFAAGERDRFRNQLLGSSKLVRFEASIRHRSGEHMLADIVAAVVLDAEGRPLESLAIGRDLREEREIEHHRRLEAVGRLVSGVAHELNNPLLTVLGNAEMLVGMKLPAAARRRAERVLGGARRCQEVVESLLRLKLRQRELSQPIDLEAVARAAVRQVAEELEHLRIPVEVTVTSDLPAVAGDETDLGQALAHIVRNAFQAVEGRSDARVAVHIEAAGGEARVTVKDSGPGMSPEVRQRAFEPFFSTREVGAGKGLGLSIALSVVQEHGGRIEIHTEETGARVVVALPVKR